MFLVILLAIVAVIALLNWVLVRGRGRAGWFPQRPDSNLGQPGDGHPMNMRLTVAAATATVLTSIALYPLLAGGIWFWAARGSHRGRRHRRGGPAARDSRDPLLRRHDRR